MASLVFFNVILVLFSLCISYVQAAGGIPAVFAFGDSILDTGNNNHIVALAKCNFLPYGRDFPHRIPTGRFGNGRVLSDLVVEGLGIKNLLPAFRSPLTKSSDIATGVCFASGGSGLDKVTATIQRVIWVQDQAADFQSAIQKLTAEVGDPAQAQAIVANSVMLISTGNNDLAITYFGTPARQTRHTISQYTDMMIQWKATFLKSLYDLGARKFAVMGTLPLGCLPGARQMMGNLICLPNVNYGAKMYNSKVAALVDQFNKQYPDAKFVFIDMFNPLNEVIHHPRRHGFFTALPCCCSVMTPVPCLASSKHVFWDFAHPSENAYKIIAPAIVNTIRTNLS